MEKNLLEQLYHRYYRELYIYIFSLCRRRSVTDDILQETFLKAFLALKDSHANMRAWLYMVARNLYYNYEKRERMLLPMEEACGTDGRETLSQERDVLEEMIQKEEQRELLKAIDCLSASKREVILLQYFGGFGLREIAAMMRLTPSNVRVLSHRAKKDLRTLMASGIHTFDGGSER